MRQDLSARLTDTLLTQIYSSDYSRTRDMVAPIAKSKNLRVDH